MKAIQRAWFWHERIVVLKMPHKRLQLEWKLFLAVDTQDPIDIKQKIKAAKRESSLEGDDNGVA